jgi:hypothetical protein
LSACLAAATLFADLPRSRGLAEEATSVAMESADPIAIALALDTWAFVALGSAPQRAVAAKFDLLRGRGAPTMGDAAAHLVWPALMHGDRAALDVGLARLESQQQVMPSARTRGLIDLARLSRAVLDGDVAGVDRFGDQVRAGRSTDALALGAVAELVWRFHSGQERDLAVEALVATLPTPALGRLFLTGAAAAAFVNGRSGAVEALQGLSQWRDHLLDPPPDLAADVTAALLAVVAGALEDEELCLAAISRLRDQIDQFTVIAWLVCVGPVGWFLAWAHRGLGDHRAALDANARAEAACRRMGTPTWLAQCLLQRVDLLMRAGLPGVEDALRAAVEACAATGLPHLRERAAVLAEGHHSAPVPERGQRHLQILRLAAEGMTNEQIARSLFLSVSTVERQFTQLYRSLGVKNRAEAVAMLRADALGTGRPVPGDGRSSAS